MQIDAGAAIEVTMLHQQELRETVEVHESPPAIDPAQVSSQETLSGLDALQHRLSRKQRLPRSASFHPRRSAGSEWPTPHCRRPNVPDGTLLDGFNVTQPGNGQLLVRVSTDAFRSIQVEARACQTKPAKGPGGLL